MIYQKEINQLLKDLFFEHWMDNKDWEEFLNELFLNTNISIELLSKDIETGIKNGYSLETQLYFVKTVLLKSKP